MTQSLREKLAVMSLLELTVKEMMESEEMTEPFSDQLSKE